MGRVLKGRRFTRREDVDAGSFDIINVETCYMADII